ncbi:MFS transporter, partial [Candidatus Bathyarchaeota archaeon]|nr:MFS transporter [Candidatus Bathyarchaeota archaeon]
FEFREIRDTIKMEKIADTSTKYVDFFKTKGNRYRLCVLVALGLFSQWSGNGVVSNYSARLYKNAGMQKEDDRLILSAGKTILDIIISTGCALLSERVNRRFTFLFSTGGMLIALLFWTLTCGLHEQHESPGANAGMIFLVWVHGVFYSCCWSGLLVGYAVEILPYSIRAKGLMFLNMSIQVSLLLNTYLNPLAFEAWEIPEGEVGHETGYGGTTWYLYLIYTIWVAGEVVFIYFMFVETRGPTLEELVRVIDGEDAQLSALDLGAVEKESVEDDVHHRTSSSEKVRRVNVSNA